MTIQYSSNYWRFLHCCSFEISIDVQFHIIYETNIKLKNNKFISILNILSKPQGASGEGLKSRRLPTPGSTDKKLTNLLYEEEDSVHNVNNRISQYSAGPNDSSK